jgi:hypothetical protein
MKQDKNNEIDLLLRRLSRRQDLPVSEVDSDHLDADEFSAYAENALPAAARARYTEHLADCSKCREIVVQLSASVPVVVAKETVPAVAPFGLREFLAGFFSPMVLRYAVPALGLIVVAVIGFSVMRSRQDSVDVAQSTRQVETPAAQTVKPQESPAGGLAVYDSPDKSASPKDSRASLAEKPIATAAEPPPPSAPASGDVSSSKTDAPAQKAAAPAANAAAAPREEPVATPAATVDEMRVDIQGRRNEQIGPQGRDLAKQKTAEGAKEQAKKAEEFQSERERQEQQPESRAARPQAGRSTTLGVASAADKDSDDGVIRSAGGRRFRRQSGMWVDTAYSSGNKIFEISRGSEPYRSLVADEPEIKKIADELDGVVIVVWKGRTYRIR